MTLSDGFWGHRVLLMLRLEQADLDLATTLVDGAEDFIVPLDTLR